MNYLISLSLSYYLLKCTVVYSVIKKTLASIQQKQTNKIQFVMRFTLSQSKA